MKKILLSLLVVLGFLGYAAAIRHPDEEASQVSVGPLATPSATPTPTPTPTDTPVAGASLTPTPVPTATPTPTPAGRYKNGSYTGDSVDAFYGYVQVRVTVSGGKISDVVFLQYPNDRRTSQEINSQAMPYLKQEAIQAQSAQVDIVSGATSTSLGFQKSLASALQQAQ